MAEAQGSRESFRDKREPAPPETEHVATESLVREHEVQEVNLRALATFAVALTVVVSTIAVLLWWAVGTWTDEPPRLQPAIEPALVTPQTGPGPGIEPFPVAERATLVAPAAENISTYGWVDRENGIVHIPVEEAMQQLIDQTTAPTDTLPAFADEPAYDLDSSGGQGAYPEGEGVGSGE
jgi:hypothetical protein